MKKVELEDIMRNLKEISNVSSRQDYNTSTAINKLINQINPIIKAEYDRLDKDKVDINCPKILIFTNRDALKIKMLVQDYMNDKLKELVIGGYKIIDYGKLDEEIMDDNTRTLYFYIKYTD